MLFYFELQLFMYFTCLVFYRRGTSREHAIVLTGFCGHTAEGHGMQKGYLDRV